MELIETIMIEKQKHIPVMNREVQEYLSLDPSACFVDCTLGLGGHARLIAEMIGRE